MLKNNLDCLRGVLEGVKALKQFDPMPQPSRDTTLNSMETKLIQVITEEANDLQPQVRRLEGFLGYVATQTSELSNWGFSYRKMNILDGKIKKFMDRYVKPGEYETADSPAVALLKDVLVHIHKIKGHVPASIPVDRHLTPANIVDAIDKTITEFLSNVPGGWLAEPTEPVKKDAPRPHSLYQVKSVIELLEHERGFANSDPRGNLAACALRLNEVISDIYGGAAQPDPPDHVMPSPATKTEPPSHKCEKCQIGLTGINLLQSWCSQCGRIEQLGCSPLIPAKQETEVIRCWGCNTDMRYTKAGGFVGAGPCVKTAIRGVTVRIAPCGKCGLPAAIEVVTGGNTVLLSRTRQGVSQ